ncbi:hypothetical protein [Candidatus Uabimicrobium amorphum]|uniref:Uncharacterized protein n=1 Tax=Uabimicrobium amorphum TaxID=2596890 RepID=A0A5S9IQW7_UABAM|nr:hypothetical protein [Candidatus Uabimicrobium amorphum]BBM86067.1 hypothetical protein UABAM_04453 [Candidatus Uabimicrobium amorphum]
MANFYQLSGRSGLFGVVNGLFSVTLSAIIVAFLQVYIRQIFPYFIEFIIVYIVYIIMVCTMYEGREKKGNNRNRKLSFVGTTISACIVLYVLWCADAVMYGKGRLFERLADPEWMLQYIQYNFFRDEVYGILEVVWVLFAFYSIGMLSKYDVFCENCYIWLEKEPLPMTINADIAKRIKQDIIVDSIAWVDEIEVAKYKPYIQLYITYCGGCDSLNLLSAEHVYEKQTSDGKEDVKEFLFQNLMLTKEKFNQLLERLGENVSKAKKEEA